MKHETKVKDLRALINVDASLKRLSEQRLQFNGLVAGTNVECVTAGFNVLLTVRKEFEGFKQVFDGLPKIRRELANSIKSRALELGVIAAKRGEPYSGATSNSVVWGDVSSACTKTCLGEKYSRRCKYEKTNAFHIVTIGFDGAVCLAEPQNAALVQCSNRDGLPLISLAKDGAAVWVRTKGKAICSESGWFVYDAAHDVGFHDTRSLEKAKSGLVRKVAETIRAKAEEAGRMRKFSEANAVFIKEQRRLTLITRLCKGATASLADAKAMGYCDPGIHAFQSRFGIGDTSSLPDLVKTGEPAAIRLALHIAKRVSVAKPTHVT